MANHACEGFRKSLPNVRGRLRAEIVARCRFTAEGFPKMRDAVGRGCLDGAVKNEALLGWEA